MRSRAALARALVLEPSVLLLDEPFGALDELTADDMAIEVVGAWTRHNFTAVMVTHNLSHAVLLADRVVVLSARPGRIVGDIPICLPRPRSSDTYEMSAYHQSIASIRRLLGSRASADEALRKRQIVSPT
jgi:NitT/TauT family transport system ATP-binding protein